MAKVNELQLKKTLVEVDYPTSKHDLVKYAEIKGADETILRELKRLPSKHYETVEDVRKAIDNIK